MENVLNVVNELDNFDVEWDWDGFWTRCDDLFIVIFTLVLVGLGIFIGLNVPVRNVFHNIHWKCPHNDVCHDDDDDSHKSEGSCDELDENHDSVEDDEKEIKEE